MVRPLRVTIYLTRKEHDYIRNVARKLFPLTPAGLARTGLVMTELIREGMERIWQREVGSAED